MLTLNACLREMAGASPGDAGGRSPIGCEFFEHDLIETSVTPLEDGLEIWAGEISDPFPRVREDEIRLRETRRFDEFDGVRVLIRKCATRPEVIVARTAGGCSPLYVSTEGTRICLTWKFDEAVRILERPQPDVDACRRILEHGNRQTRAQIIRGVHMLWPGERVSFSETGLVFEACEDLSIATPAAFSDRARATDAFLEVVAEAIKPFLIRSKRPLLEFSGGMDSTCVALAASSIREKLDSYGVIHPDVVGRQQRSRREELIESVGLTDYTGSSVSVLPIDAILNEECQVTFNDDAYRMCLMTVLADNGLADVDLILSGIGGDELSKGNTHLRDAWELPGHASYSSLVGSMGRFDMFMRRGIWPVSPFVRPAVVNFCRALPGSMRKDRLFNKLVIARAGLSDGFLAPRYHETFANVLMLQGIHCDFDAFFASSILSDYGIADVSAILSKAALRTELGISVKLVSRMYFLVKMEMVLRRYVK